MAFSWTNLADMITKFAYLVKRGQNIAFVNPLIQAFLIIFVKK